LPLMQQIQWKWVLYGRVFNWSFVK
jgi:hypothetical protein